MSPLAACWTAGGGDATAASRLLDAPVTDSWRDGRFSVAVAGGRVALHVTDHVIVAVEGRLDSVSGKCATQPAEEAIAQCWLHAGPGALDQLVGDLIFVVYDRRPGQVYVARDLTGARPGYVTHDGRTHMVFTHLASAVRSRAFRLEPDRDWMRSFLQARWPATEITPYAGLQAVGPGHVAVPVGSSWQQTEHARWRFDPPPELRPAQAAELFREHFDAAVRDRIADSSGPVAVTTSGGLDSTSVLVTARAVHPDHDLIALSIPFKDAKGDERKLQALAAEAAGAQLHWVELGTDGPFGAEPTEVFELYGAPPQAPNWFFHRRMEIVATELGVTQVLDGEDGDGVLGGNASFLYDLFAQGRWLAWLREARAISRHHDENLGLLLRDFRVSVRRAGRPGNVFGPSARFAAGRTSYVNGGSVSRLMEGTYDLWTVVPGGMGHPFLDRRVVEFSLTLPWQHVIKGGVTKQVLREAMRGRLPDEVRTRIGKANLAAPFNAAVTGPQHRWLDDGLTLARADRTGMFDEVDWEAVAAGGASGDHFRGYRVAMAAWWTDWLSNRGPSA